MPHSAHRGRLLEGLPTAEEETFETFETLITRAADGPVTVERIVSRGHASPEDFWYDQETDEWVMVVGGRAGLEIRGEPDLVELGPGDWIWLPAHLEHRVAWTEDPTVWLAVHVTPPAG